MDRIILILLFSAQFISGFAQSNDKRENRTTFYPLNIPYALFGRFQTSIEFGVNELDNFLVGGHFNKQLRSVRGSGGGFEAQYRVNFNRDSNVQFRSKNYWGPYFEYDRLKDITNAPYPTTQHQISMLNMGVLYGSKYAIGNSVLFDMFIGLGLVRQGENSGYGYGELRSVYPYFKGGVQFGFKF